VEDERFVGLIGELQAKNYYAYVYRRMWKALRRAGEPVARCTVQRLMREQGIQGAKRRGKPWRTTKPDPEAQRRPYLVRRDFSAGVPIGWVADLSYPAVLGGARLLAFVLDAFSRIRTAPGRAQQRCPGRRAGAFFSTTSEAPASDSRGCWHARTVAPVPPEARGAPPRRSEPHRARGHPIPRRSRDRSPLPDRACRGGGGG
jgi:helix-turn-helix protein